MQILYLLPQRSEALARHSPWPCATGSTQWWPAAMMAHSRLQTIGILFLLHYKNWTHSAAYGNNRFRNKTQKRHRQPVPIVRFAFLTIESSPRSCMAKVFLPWTNGQGQKKSSSMRLQTAVKTKISINGPPTRSFCHWQKTCRLLPSPTIYSIEHRLIFTPRP